MKMAIMMVVILSLYVAGNVYIFVRMLQALSQQCIFVRICVSLLFWFAALSLFISFGLRHFEISEILQRTLFVVGSSWMVFILYMTLALIVVDLLGLLFPIKGGVWYALVLTFVLLCYGYINYRMPRAERIEIVSDKFLHDMRIVAISDVHLGYGTTRSDLAKYVEIINAEHPDIVLIAGDLIDNSIEPVRRSAMERELAKIDAPHGVYMTVGNHEYISGIDACVEWLDKGPVTLLRDSVVVVNGVNIVGRDDQINRERCTLAELMQGADAELPMVVVDHQPYAIGESVDAGAVLHLSGHTHHGQIFPLSLLVEAMYEQSHGYRMWGDTHVFVSSGLSLWGPPFRIGTDSDYAVIECRKL